MQIGLWNDSKSFPNLCSMKISAYHKSLGDSTELYDPNHSYDLIYASKVFTESEEPDFGNTPVIRGGSGYDLHNKLPDYIEEEKVQDSKMFWILFAVSLPLTVPLMLAIIAVFVSVWVGLAAVIAAAVAVLVAMVTVGTAASLIGIIYGVIQLFTSVPVGLYEIGIGVVVAGVVMFAGILLYNFAVRLVPLLIRLVGRLFKFVLKKLRVLFNFLRRECAKL